MTTAAPAPDAFVRLCPSGALLARLGEKWSALVLARLAAGPARFGALRRGLDGISQKMLTQTLRRLERDGLVTRAAVDARPPAVEYALSQLGLDYLPVALAAKAWAERNLAAVERCNAAYDARATD